MSHFGLKLVLTLGSTIPYAYLKVVMERIAHCKDEDDYRALLPQHIDREALKNAYR